MNIQKTKTMPNGASAISHRVEKITIIDGSATATITSFTDNAGNIGWQELVDVPIGIFASGDPLADVARWTIAAGSYLDGGAIIDPNALDIDRARARKKQEIVTAWRAAEGAGYKTSFGVAQSDPESRARVTPMVLSAFMASVGNKPFAAAWRMADNTAVAMDAVKLCQFGAEMVAANDALYTKAQTLKTALLAATTLAAIAAIAW